MAVDAINSITSGVASQRPANILNEVILGMRKSIARASSGTRITSPEVDAAGLAQYTKLEAQIGRLDAASANVSNAVSFSQTQDGALQAAQSALNRMGELSILAQDPTKSSADLSLYQAEFGQLQEFVSHLSNEEFNGINLFGGSGQAVTNDADGGTLAANVINFGDSTSAGGIGDTYGGISVSTPGNAASALDTVQSAIENLAALRANVGANLQGLNMTGETLSITNQNLSEAASRIMSADIASESTQSGAYQVLIEAGMINLVRMNNLAQSTFQGLA